MRTLSTALMVALAACTSAPKDDTSSVQGDSGGLTAVDADGDGYVQSQDCDDEDATVNPGATEVCDGRDNDCDGMVDEDLADADGDGTCDARDHEDCDGVDNDGDGQIDEDQPDADGDGICDGIDVEECDGVDNDGDGLIDEDFLDNDGDGIADCVDSEDCDGVDNDGDGTVDEGYPDTDADGVADCMDTEECDGLDNDGDGDIDEGFPDTDGDGTADCVDSEECDGLDNDGDGEVDEGFGDSDADGVADCVDSEECDGLDNDGDGEVDEGFSDTDGDGTADCMDSEECDGLDNDGDGLVDEGVGDDEDGDGYSECDGDCDDDDADRFPGNAEVQDRLDNDCDDFIDEDFISYGDVVITEIMVDPAAVGDTAGEYFEVYNAASFAIYLDNWYVYDYSTKSFTVGSGVVVAAGGYAVLGKNDNTLVNGGVDVDYEYGTGMTFPNGSSDAIFLSMDGTVIDDVVWDDGTTWPSTSAGYAMELDLASLDADTNDDAGYWCEATSEITSGGDYGTPGADNDYCGQLDHDGDGYTTDDGDCDDFDADTWPGAPETVPGVDNDCDGVVGNTLPVAVADVTNSGTIYTCDELLLDGSSSYDPDGDPILGYDWTLESQPAASGMVTADIDATTDTSPVFVADAEGTYSFGLVVSDGTDDSSMDTVDVEVLDRGYNSTPTADAGSDSSYADAVVCTSSGYGYTCPDCSTVVFALDGTGSSDGDGDALAYQWSTSSGLATFSDDTDDSPSLTVSGVAATYGTTTTETISVELDVTDCMGATSSDTVEITYTCTGS